MTKADKKINYNFETFSRESLMPIVDYGNSPLVGKAAPDFPLWDLEGNEINLAEFWKANDMIVIEFGSFT